MQMGFFDRQDFVPKVSLLRDKTRVLSEAKGPVVVTARHYSRYRHWPV